MKSNTTSSARKKKHLSISSPSELIRLVHIDNDLNWTFDPSVNPHQVFRKLKVVGKGGFGTVCQIVHLESMQLLAGKLINPNLVADSNAQGEIEHEIELMRGVRCREAVRYYGSVLFDDSLLILLEYCDRGSIRDILDARQRVLDEHQIAVVMRDVLLGLKTLHERYHIVHRDIKAANILLNGRGEVKIADFGVSRRFDSGTQQTMTIVGTPYWMAPEVISGSNYSFPADIWSVGITAVEMAEGAPPYVEFAPTKAMIEIHLNGFPGYRFEALHSAEFMDFVSRCVRMDPSMRATPDELLCHPFITAVSQIPRREVMLELIVDQIPKLSLSSPPADPSSSSISSSTATSASKGANDSSRATKTRNAQSVAIDSSSFNFNSSTYMMGDSAAMGTFVADDLASNSINAFNMKTSTFDSFNPTMGTLQSTTGDSQSFGTFQAFAGSNAAQNTNAGATSTTFDSFQMVSSDQLGTFVASDSNSFASLNQPMGTFVADSGSFDTFDASHCGTFVAADIQSQSQLQPQLQPQLQEQKQPEQPQSQPQSRPPLQPQSQPQSRPPLQPQNQSAPLSRGQIELMKKEVKIQSSRIPFVPFSLCSDNDKKVADLYSMKGRTAIVDIDQTASGQSIRGSFNRRASGKDNVPIFREDGIIDPIAVLSHRDAPSLLALSLSLAALYFFGVKGLTKLILLSLIVRFVIAGWPQKK